MTRIRKASIAIVAAAAIPVGSVAMFNGPAFADYEKERDFRVGGADVDFSVELERGKYEVSVDLDDARPGSRWKVVIKHNGTKIHGKKHTADRDGEVDIDKVRPNTKGKDKFK